MEIFCDFPHLFTVRAAKEKVWTQNSMYVDFQTFLIELSKNIKVCFILSIIIKLTWIFESEDICHLTSAHFVDLQHCFKFNFMFSLK